MSRISSIFPVITVLLLWLNGCAGVHADAPTTQMNEPKPIRTYVFTCADDFTFTARTTADDKAWLFLPSGTLKLQKDTPDTYRSEDVLFKIEGETSWLEEPGGKHSGCRNDRRQAIWEHAKLSGADFRAIGNEPGWNMEIRDQSEIILTTNYGAEKHVFDLPEPEIDKAARTTRYKVDQAGQEMILTITGEPCNDSMSGEEFESWVKVVFNGKTLNGCGRALH